MSQVSPFLREHTRGYSYYCPGCKRMHSINTKGGPGPSWSFDGNVNRPTFGPSVRHFYPAQPAEPGFEAEPEKTFCHYFIKKGIFEYCGDCLHDLKGKHVPMRPIPEDEI